MMERDALFSDFLLAWNTQDADRAVSLMTQDCIFEPSIGPHPWGDRLIGREAVRE